MWIALQTQHEPFSPSTPKPSGTLNASTASALHHKEKASPRAKRKSKLLTYVTVVCYPLRMTVLEKQSHSIAASTTGALDRSRSRYKGNRAKMSNVIHQPLPGQVDRSQVFHHSDLSEQHATRDERAQTTDRDNIKGPMVREFPEHHERASCPRRMDATQEYGVPEKVPLPLGKASAACSTKSSLASQISRGGEKGKGVRSSSESRSLQNR